MLKTLLMDVGDAASGDSPRSIRVVIPHHPQGGRGAFTDGERGASPHAHRAYYISSSFI
jgi:hypothetical protein